MSVSKKGIEFKMLTRKQIYFILERLAQRTVVEPSKDFPYRISVKTAGYSDDKEIGELQATLSIMLEMAK